MSASSSVNVSLTCQYRLFLLCIAFFLMNYALPLVLYVSCFDSTNFRLHQLQGKPYKFSHFIFLSRTYHLSVNEESELGARRPEGRNPKSKKAKKAKISASALPQVGEEYDLLDRKSVV